MLSRSVYKKQAQNVLASSQQQLLFTSTINNHLYHELNTFFSSLFSFGKDSKMQEALLETLLKSMLPRQ